MTTPPERVLDARGLLPPEPMRRALAALEALPPGETLVLLLLREPFPLYARLDAAGFTHAAALRDDGTYEIRIARPR